MGAVAVPEMEKLGYNSKLACGVVAAGGTLGVMIPPSVLLVFYGAVTETSAGHMLIAGIIPGTVSVLIFMVGILFMAWRDPSLARGHWWHIHRLVHSHRSSCRGGHYSINFHADEKKPGKR